MASDPFSNELPEVYDGGRDKPSVDDLFGLTYSELKRLAYSVRKMDSRTTISPTTLVNEAYVKLSSGSGVRFESRLHFSRIAARAMRQILIEAARRRNAAKRGGGNQIAVSLDDSFPEIMSLDTQILALHEALNDLAKLSPRQATVVETRYFGGFTDRQIAEYLNVSEATILRDWRLAKAFLSEQMHKSA